MIIHIILNDYVEIHFYYVKETKKEFIISQIQHRSIQHMDLTDKIMDLKQRYHLTNTLTERKLIQQQIDLIDKKINELVYKLYDLTEQEIQIIEDNI